MIFSKKEESPLLQALNEIRDGPVKRFFLAVVKNDGEEGFLLLLQSISETGRIVLTPEQVQEVKKQFDIKPPYDAKISRRSLLFSGALGMAGASIGVHGLNTGRHSKIVNYDIGAKETAKNLIGYMSNMELTIGAGTMIAGHILVAKEAIEYFYDDTHRSNDPNASRNARYQELVTAMKAIDATLTPALVQSLKASRSPSP